MRSRVAASLASITGWRKSLASTSGARRKVVVTAAAAARAIIGEAWLPKWSAKDRQ
jgi:hypothetical protein